MGADHKSVRDQQALNALLGLRNLVLGGGVAPGERLSEVALSIELGVSRTPLRAALFRLEEEGLLERLPAGGYAVRRFSLADVCDAIELRGVLEGTALRLAAERGVDPELLEQMRELVLAMDETFADHIEDLDYNRYVTLNAAFHSLLALLPGSQTMRRELERTRRMPFAAPSAFLEAQDDVMAFRRSLFVAQRQHHDMLEALERREGARAEALGREHAQIARRNLDFVMKQDRSLVPRVPGLRLVTS
ncbi:GntR family transcriptional regulator [Martelella alba]|uniref:GntR family transcriptional regulator n=1 Tax=Martelella alba TaxID=2590451 RepID=A0A506U6I3_9HYPH|nr:GntR family transcriptional regulator [Martelella alba]TPW29108.1 GntR family transcriptional regulator [Martelella alba]